MLLTHKWMYYVCLSMIEGKMGSMELYFVRLSFEAIFSISLVYSVVNMTQVFLHVSNENTMPYSTHNFIRVSKQANMCLFMQLLPTSQYQ